MIEYKETIFELLKHSTVGTLFAGAVAYIYKVYRKDEDFSIARFVMNCIFAVFVGQLIGKFLPGSWDNNLRDGVLTLCGFLANPILNLLDKQGLELLMKRFNLNLKREATQNLESK